MYLFKNGSKYYLAKNNNKYHGWDGGTYVIKDGRLVWANPNIYLRAPYRTSASQGKGTPYIDTGVVVNDNSYGIDITYCAYNGPWEGMIVTNGFGMYRYQYDRLAIGSNTAVSTTIQNFKKTTIKYNIGNYYNDGKVHFIYPQDTSRNNDVETTGFSGTVKNTTLIGSTWNYQSGIDYYSVKLVKNNKLIRNYVPVPQGLEIGSFTVPSNGMFDLVTQTFFENKGTGSFTHGTDS